MLWLVFVLGILFWVVARQTASVVAAAELDSLRVERSDLEAQRTELIGRVRRAESRRVLGERVEKMGLRAAVDSEIVILAAPDTLRR
jgi:hypothetical protein